MPLVFNKAPNNNFTNPKALGRYTIQFVNNYFYEPEKVIDKLNGEYVSGGEYKNDMFL